MPAELGPPDRLPHSTVRYNALGIAHYLKGEPFSSHWYEWKDQLSRRFSGRAPGPRSRECPVARPVLSANLMVRRRVSEGELLDPEIGNPKRRWGGRYGSVCHCR